MVKEVKHGKEDTKEIRTDERKSGKSLRTEKKTAKNPYPYFLGRYTGHLAIYSVRLIYCRNCRIRL